MTARYSVAGLSVPAFKDSSVSVRGVWETDGSSVDDFHQRHGRCGRWIGQSKKAEQFSGYYLLLNCQIWIQTCTLG